MGLYLPIDYKEQEPYGTCGLAVIAALEHREVSNIKKDWESTIGRWDGYANFRDIEKLLKEHNISFIRKNGKKATEFPKIDSSFAIIRVQWLKDDGTEYYWKVAPTHTHYVLLEKQEEKQFVFCNSVGWFGQDTPFYQSYFIGETCGGYITSYLEILPFDLKHLSLIFQLERQLVAFSNV